MLKDLRLLSAPFSCTSLYCGSFVYEFKIYMQCLAQFQKGAGALWANYATHLEMCI